MPETEVVKAEEVPKEEAAKAPKAEDKMEVDAEGAAAAADARRTGSLQTIHEPQFLFHDQALLMSSCYVLPLVGRVGSIGILKELLLTAGGTKRSVG